MRTRLNCALEQYRDAHLDSAAAHFVLAYHYLTQGNNDAATNELKEVVRLAPTDQLSAELLRQLSGAVTAATPAPTRAPAGEPTAQPAAATNAAAPARQGNLVGAWKASPAKDVTIALTVSQDNHFTWTVTQQGKSLPIEGNLTYENGVLNLTQAKGDPLAGTVTWQDDNHFTFQAQGGGPNDLGLAFTK